MSSFLSAVGAGLAQGAASYRETEAERPFREERIKQAQTQTAQAQADLELAPLQKQRTELAIEQLTSQIGTMQREADKVAQFNSFGLYDASRNIKHLNQDLASAKKSPVRANMTKDILRYSPLEETEANSKLLLEAGITDLKGLYSDKELRTDYVIAELANGERKLIDMNKAYIGTGYAKKLEDERLDRMFITSKILDNLRTGGSVRSETAREKMAAELALAKDIPIYKAYMAIGNNSDANLSAIQDDSGIPYGEALSDNITEEGKTLKNKNIDNADAVRTSIDEITTDRPMSELSREELREVGTKISSLEKYLDVGMDSAQRTNVLRIKNLISLSSEAGEMLSDKETGPLDNFLFGIKKYISNNTDGTEGLAYYETLRNLVRKGLMGSDVTKYEGANFLKSAGSAYQQLGPVLSQLKVQMVTMRNDLENIAANNDPYIAEYRLGMSMEEIDTAINSIDDRINLVDTAISNGASNGDITPQTKSLNELYEEAKNGDNS